MATQISGLIPAGSLDRRIQILGLTYTKTKGEAIRAYAEILSVRAAKAETGGGEEEKSGTVVALGTVVWTIRYHTQISVESPNYEALALSEIVGDPIYLLDEDNQIMYDLFGNPLISIEDSGSIFYDILHIEEIGRKVGYNITAQRWR
jgi:hypothetical protein